MDGSCYSLWGARIFTIDTQLDQLHTIPVLVLLIDAAPPPLLFPLTIS